MLPLNFELKKYNYNLYEWYSPVFVLLMFNELCKLYPNNEDHYLFKKAVEAMQGAMALLGARALHENNVYMMQMNRQSQRPDVIASTRAFENGLPILKISPLEVTSMEAHTNHTDIAKFLMEAKLKKDYPKETIFICIINKVISYDIHRIAKRIKSANKENPIYIVGKALHTISTVFNIATPQPITAKTSFDLSVQGRDYPYPDRMIFEEDKMNMNPQLAPYSAKPINLFEFFMLDKERIEKAFGRLR